MHLTTTHGGNQCVVVNNEIVYMCSICMSKCMYTLHVPAHTVMVPPSFGLVVTRVRHT